MRHGFANFQSPLFESVTFSRNDQNAVTSGTALTLLHRIVVPANLLSFNGDAIHLFAFGFVTAALGTKDFQVSYGGSLVFDTGALTLATNSQWWMDILAQRRNVAGVLEMRFKTHFISSASAVVNNHFLNIVPASPVDFTVQANLDISGQATAGDSITQQSSIAMLV